MENQVHNHSKNNPLKSNQNEKVLISKRVEETKKDIDVLRDKLQELINTGLKKPEQFSVNDKNNEIPAQHESHKVIIKSHDLKHLEKGEKQERITKESSPDRRKQYNVEEARKYIRKQKEKRAEQAKLLNKGNNDAELKKQRLQELHKKSLELVAKNVENKRERSKSRDRNNELRLDKNVRAASTVNDKKQPNRPSRSKSCEKTNPGKLKLGEYKSLTTITGGSLIPEKKKSEKSPNTKTESLKSKTNKLKTSSKLNSFAETNSKNQMPILNGIKLPISNQIDSLNLVEPEPKLKSTNSVVKSIPQNVTVRESHSNTKQEDKNEKTQREKTKFPSWLQETHSIQSNPHNFINTVKKKLNLAVNSPRIISGVDIQKPLIENRPITPENNPKSLEELRELIQKSTKTSNPSITPLASFVSHQFQNLEMKSLDNFELVSNQNRKNSKITVKENESESDTSKNIPDISSESGTSIKSHPESIKERESKLNSNKTDLMNLKPYYTMADLKSSSSNILKSQLSKKSEKENNKNVNRKLFNEESDVYSSKFTSEKSYLSENGLKKSRDSIISYNVSKSKTSPREPSGTSSIKTVEKYSSISKDIPMSKDDVPESETSISSNSVKSIKSKYSLEHIPQSKSSSEASIKSIISIPASENQVKTSSNNERLVNSPEFYSLLSSQVSKMDKNPKSNHSDQEPIKKLAYIEPLEEPKLILSTSKTSSDIHLKFEAEIHLLNDFNESLRQFSAVEKAFESIKTKNEPKVENKIIQTSFDLSPLVTENSKNRSIISSINYSRGDLESNNELTKTEEDSFNISILLNTDNNKSVSSTMHEPMSSFFNCENMPPTNQCAGLSLIMFEQLIKDEDVKLENLKTILRIREKVLLDRTKSELTYLEIQRKHLKETGRLHEASLIKKKQRGILLKHQQEQHEMQRLKQMQKEASKERKIILKEQWKLIKSQLTTDNMISKIKMNQTKHSKCDRRKSGPLKVIQTQSESIHSEASVSRSSFGEDVLNITSHSVVSKVSEIDANDLLSHSHNKFDTTGHNTGHLDGMKRTLLMREAVLEKRRETAEELLQWHRKLLDEEKRISDLEQLANNIISTEQIKSNSDVTNKHKFTGKELNQLWTSLTGSDEQKFIEKKIYLMSQIALERFCKSAKEYSAKSKKFLSDKVNVSSEQQQSEKSPINNSNEYTLEFDGDSFVETNEMADIGRSQISSISQLIDNLSKIKEEISLISRKSKRSLRESITRENEKKHTFSAVQQERKSLNEEREKNNSIANSSEDVTTLETDKISEDVKSQCTILSENIETANVEVENSNGITPEDVVLSAEENEVKTIEVESLVKSSEPTNPPQSVVHSIDDKYSELKQKSEQILTSETIDDTVNTEDLTLSQVESTKDMQDFVFNATEKNALDLTSSERTEIGTDENESVEIVIQENRNDKEGSEMILSTEKSVVEESSELPEEYSLKPSEDVNSSSVGDESVKEDLQLQIQDNSDTSNKQNSSIESISDQTQNDNSKIKSTTDSSPKEINSFEEKEEDSESQTSQKSNDCKKVPKSGIIDVKKRVSEIMADANQFSRNDKSPRLQDFYVTAYDIIPPASIDLLKQDALKRGSKPIYGNEAEELLKKQLAIEKEIKQIEQQQKEQLPYVFMREIPNKPPPPYTPPSSLAIPNIVTEVPVKPEEIDEITKYSAKILHKAYVSNNLDNVSISENTLNLITKNVGKECFKFVFNLCKELAQNHYNQFKNGTGPSWLIVLKKSQLANNKPYDLNGLEKYINEKLKEIFKFKKTEIREKSIIKWSKKKRDHVDEILVFESQGEEMEWINYDKDELLVMDKVCNDIMNNLLLETGNIFSNLLSESIV